MSYLLALIVGLLVLGLFGSGYSQPRRYTGTRTSTTTTSIATPTATTTEMNDEDLRPHTRVGGARRQRADAAQRCRTSKVGSTTYTTCENPEKRCRSHRMGSTTYTTCDR